MSRIVKLGQVKTPTVTPGYIGYYPGFQAATDTNLLDRSGKGNHATFGAQQTASYAWTTLANRFSVALNAGGSQNAAANLANGSAFIWNPALESLVAAFRLTCTATASNGPIFGNAHAAPSVGFKLEVQATTGVLRLNRYSTGAQTVVNTTTEAVADGTEHGVGFAWDAVAQRAYIYVDGVIASAFAGGSLITATDWFPFTTNNLCIGGVGHSAGGGGAALTYASAFRGIHLAKRTGALPSNAAGLFRRLNQFPHVLISATELPA